MQTSKHGSTYHCEKYALSD